MKGKDMKASEYNGKNSALSVFFYIFVQVIGDVILSILDGQTVHLWVVISGSLLINAIIGFSLMKNNKTYLSDFYSVSAIAIIGIILWLLSLFVYIKNDWVWIFFTYYNNLNMIVFIGESEIELYYIVMLLLNLIPSLMYWIGLSLKRFIAGHRQPV